MSFSPVNVGRTVPEYQYGRELIWFFLFAIILCIYCQHVNCLDSLSECRFGKRVFIS